MTTPIAVTHKVIWDTTDRNGGIAYATSAEEAATIKNYLVMALPWDRFIKVEEIAQTPPGAKGDLHYICPELDWGPSGVVPATTKAAWGARGILRRGHPPFIDVPPDRKSLVGVNHASKLHLTSLLTERGPKDLGAGTILGAIEGEIVTLHQDDEIKMVGRRNGGYVYLAAWLV